jgi:cold-inducible RNA-binding protein
MKNIYVGSLSFSTSEDELRRAFETYGPVERVTMMRDRNTGQQRGFAFVEMTSDADAQTAITGLNSSSLGGRQIRVGEARPKNGLGDSFQRFRR